ncbi:mitochondrial ornithine transporter 1 isoform X2 [Ixodes scapularis]|uniref:mitochondrial ornithine transporter 1 isoform X2 n=1 Tax=Ixodes scapularis TaxID=6945 RepID=UPI001A9E6242|nr:mitochondrial ornithine transporter 1 isoform X2 [Ixodes scapularis]
MESQTSAWVTRSTRSRRKCKLKWDSRAAACTSRSEKRSKRAASLGYTEVACHLYLDLAFTARYTYLDGSIARSEIPFTAGLQTRVVVGGVIASTARAIIECPLEYAKISRQIGQTWTLRKVYTGFGVTWLRTVGLMTSYFIFLDSGRRHFNDYFQRPLLGPFLISGLAATAAWWIVWPLEYMKSQVQGHYGKNVSLLQRMRSVYSEKGGFAAMYRGLAPGSIRSFVANGTSMIVMSYAQRKVTELGLRD